MRKPRNILLSIIIFSLLFNLGCQKFGTKIAKDSQEPAQTKLFAGLDPKEPQIVATLGPSSSSIPVLVEMINAGLTMARVNSSHGTHESNKILIDNVRAASKITNKTVKILVDLQGPKIRVDKLAEPLILEQEKIWVIGNSEDQANFPEFSSCFIPTVYKNLVQDARIGSDIFFDDGFLHATALEKVQAPQGKSQVLKIKIKIGGKLKSNKGINLPGSTISAPSLTQKDLADLRFAIAQNVDAIGLSFVRHNKDVELTKARIRALGANIPVVAKIETPEAVKNLKAIIKSADGLMVARGDLAVEIGFEKVPGVQRRLIKLALAQNKAVITATQMLESMTENTRPTRAEADNIAHAYWQGTTATMLSGESAVGSHPALAIATMKKIALVALKEKQKNKNNN